MSFTELDLYLSRRFNGRRNNEVLNFQTPPEQKVILLEDSMSSCADRFTIDMSKTLVLDNPKMIRNIIDVINNMPSYNYEIDKEYLGLEKFGIVLSFDEKSQIVSVKKDEVTINFQHDGLSNPLTMDLKASIAALTIISDKSVLEDIAKNGIVFGCLLSRTINTFDDGIWKIVPIGINLPDEHYSTSERPILDDQSIRYLDVISTHNNIPHYVNYLKSLKPVGIFVDCRHS